jgi:peroxiredoxin
VPCREHLAQLREHEREFEALGASVVAVTFEPHTAISRFVPREGVAAPVLSDPDRQAYRAFGLRRGRAVQVWTWGALKAYLKGALHGRLPRVPNDDIAQLGGDFVLDAEGTVVWAYRSKDPSDRPPPEDILRVVRDLALPASPGEA